MSDTDDEDDYLDYFDHYDYYYPPSNAVYKQLEAFTFARFNLPSKDPPTRPGPPVRPLCLPPPPKRVKQIFSIDPEKMRSEVKFMPSQTGSSDVTPVPYTADPLSLCWYDLRLFVDWLYTIPGILLPWSQWRSGAVDELYPSFENVACMALHGFLIVLQGTFLLSLPFFLLFPVWTAAVYVVVVMLINHAVCYVLNGSASTVESTVDPTGGDKLRMQGQNECWIYLNGVSVGRHWLEGNVNRLAVTFRRPIIGVHNRTCGILFDLVQCIVERNFGYATADIRRAYEKIKECLLDENHKSVILILHSQGGIEGGLVVDWLLSELPYDIVNKLEIYTFGSAANHFNNPHRNTKDMYAAADRTMPGRNDKAVRYIEHYANQGDFVARWGVLNFTKVRNRYMGRVFVRPGTGHLLNQHYLNQMFPLNDSSHVLDNNDFMDMEVTVVGNGGNTSNFSDQLWENGNCVDSALVEDIHSPVEPVSRRAREIVAAKLANRKQQRLKVRHFSRLWCYRNGGSPELDHL